MDVAVGVSSLDFTSGLAEHLRGGHVVVAYALLALTTLPPLVPNSVLLVTGGVMAAEGRLNIALVLLAVAGSALVGDMLIHRSGRALSGRVLGLTKRRPRRAALLSWAALRIKRHGVPFIIGVRFLPSGRVIGGMAAGVVRYPARRYAFGAGIAEAVWASYSVGAGYISGREASNSFYALSLGLGISLLVAGCGTVAQWISRAREHRSGGHSPVIAVSYRNDGTVTTGPPRSPAPVAAAPAGPPAGPPRPAHSLADDESDDSLTEPLRDAVPAPASSPDDEDAGRWCPTSGREGTR